VSFIPFARLSSLRGGEARHAPVDHAEIIVLPVLAAVALSLNTSARRERQTARYPTWRTIRVTAGMTGARSGRSVIQGVGSIVGAVISHDRV
jgi:hypothetical protein